MNCKASYSSSGKPNSGRLARRRQRKRRFFRRRRPVSLPILADVINRADGSVVLKPKSARVTGTGDTWLTPVEACKVLGLSQRMIYRYCNPINPYLVCRRPARSKMLISMKTVECLYQATLDPDFWSDRLQQNEVREFARNVLRELKKK